MADSLNSVASSISTDPWVVIDYEVDMFISLCRLLKPGNQVYAAMPHHIKNAIVESALLHCRILADIILSRGIDNDDICLSKLLPRFQSQALERLRHEYGNRKDSGTPCWTLNKMLMHSTKHRCDQYDYTILLNHMYPLLATVWLEVQKHRKLPMREQVSSGPGPEDIIRNSSARC